MMKRPVSLALFGIFLLSVAVSFPVQIMVIYHQSPLEWVSVLSKLTSLNWLVMASALLNACLVWRASPQLKSTLPLLMIFMLANNWVVGRWHIDYSADQTWFASLIFVGAHGVLFQKSIRDLLKHPEKRWWLRPSRRTVEVSAFVSPFNGTAFKAKTFDISERGAFISVGGEEIPAREPRGVRHKKISVDDRVTLCLTLGLAQIRCDARVVRTTSAQGTYPKGIGLSFDKLPRQQRRELRRYIQASA